MPKTIAELKQEVGDVAVWYYPNGDYKVISALTDDTVAPGDVWQTSDGQALIFQAACYVKDGDPIYAVKLEVVDDVKPGAPAETPEEFYAGELDLEDATEVDIETLFDDSKLQEDTTYDDTIVD